jgi:4-amino-4-deoxy-L-arabinose transferase-like glycosyltransferase
VSFSPFLSSLPSNVRLLLVIVCTLHFGLGAGLGLSVDEAHYALYAAHLDWSYFDHPPLVGWAQWPLVALNAPTAILRLVPELLWLATALLVYALAERLLSTAPADRNIAPPPGQAGFWSVLVLALAPLLNVLGIGLLPDTLLVFFTVATMWLTLDLMEPANLRRSLPWFALGIALGLAGLSKYTAIFTAIAAGLCLLLAYGVGLLRNARLWMALTVALLVVVPVAYWNSQNHWISFTYQAQHGAGGDWRAVHVLRFLVVQLLVYGPLLMWGWTGLRHSATGRTGRSLGLFFAVPFVLLALLSVGGTSLPHWTAPACVALAPFAGLGLARAWQRGRRSLIRGLVALQALLCVASFGLMLTAGLPLFSNASGQGNTAQPSNPFADLHGWDVAGARALALAHQQGLASVAVQNWTLASRLGWYARPLPVYVLEDRFDQFDLWAGDLAVGGNTLLVDWSQLGYVPPVGANGFADCTLLETQVVQRLGRLVSRFHFYACNNWSGQPKPRLLGTAP